MRVAWFPADAYRNRAQVRLRFRSVGDSGEPYPPWVRALVGRSGVYVIRERIGRRPQIVYVGESHTDRLYETMTRHFQAWRRLGKQRSDFPGVTYPRERCDAAAVITAPDEAFALQNEYIGALGPRDNVQGALQVGRADVEDVVPF